MLDSNEDFQLVDKSFPHIGHKLKLLWGHKECAELLHNLLTDTRDGTRQGFPKPISSALFKLLALHDNLYPPKNLKTDIWADVYKR